MPTATVNYYFNVNYAQTVSCDVLFRVVYGLIEVQRLATLYRAGVPSTLSQAGICFNLDYIVHTGTYHEVSTDIPINKVLRLLFFTGNTVPIHPYERPVNYGYKDGKAWRWKSYEVGDTRMRLLNQMILDLTEYLTEQA